MECVTFQTILKRNINQNRPSTTSHSPTKRSMFIMERVMIKSDYDLVKMKSPFMYGEGMRVKKDLKELFL
ncbi:hypothetical protein A3K73_05415 [Candidatus Pacearchaeota archaeon RBG_13_36_9]|nr:MAG: hypothetical protein A3K73_05415 [Candidatus Pacearchaeota archaeon RBG_13_36_9]